jgi:hypothetical protein
MRKESINYRNGRETMSTLDWEEITSYYGINATLPIDQTRREKEKTIIT